MVSSRNLRASARNMQKIARIQELSQMTPEALQAKLLKEQMTRMKRNMRRKFNKMMFPF